MILKALKNLDTITSIKVVYLTTLEVFLRFPANFLFGNNIIEDLQNLSKELDILLLKTL